MIGGNITADIQVSSVRTNDIGESIQEWQTVIQRVKGWLDYSSGEAQYEKYKAKIAEMTHVFICDYFPITFNVSNCRLIINGRCYDVLMIDDPMLLHRQIEIYLKETS